MEKIRKIDDQSRRSNIQLTINPRRENSRGGNYQRSYKKTSHRLKDWNSQDSKSKNK